jgi:intracellular sulfur oxidation DsrE/DsrF family protein
MAEEDTVGRRSVMAGVGIAVAGLVAAGSAGAQTSRKSGSRFQPARHAIDAWFDQLPGTHRIFVDTASAEGGADGIGYANNLYLATDSAYGGENAKPAIVVCFRHFSTPFGYNDAIWAKYGEIFNSLIQFPDPATKAAPKINLMNSAAHKTLPNRGVTLDELAAKGTQFAICNMATQFIAGAIAQQTGGKANEIHDELVANAVKSSHFVSAGVMALTRAQEYGYSVLIAG